MTAAPVLQRPDQTSTNAADLLADADDLQLHVLDGLRGLPAEFPELTIRTMPPRSFLPNPLEVAQCL